MAWYEKLISNAAIANMEILIDLIYHSLVLTAPASPLHPRRVARTGSTS
jgi:hypothetical protein